MHLPKEPPQHLPPSLPQRRPPERRKQKLAALAEGKKPSDGRIENLVCIREEYSFRLGLPAYQMSA